MYYGQPMGRKKTLRVVMALLVLAWATQVLCHQWGYGATVATAAELPEMGAEKFVPAASAPAGTLELRSEASVFGGEVRLKQICRWSEADNDLFAPVADLVVARLTNKSPTLTVTLGDLRSLLRDAGLNLSAVRFSGPISCVLTRPEAQGEDGAANAAPGALAVAVGGSKTISGTPVTSAAPATQPAEDGPTVSLKQRLTEDLASQLQLPIDSLQVSFNDSDEKLLSLSEPQFHFQVEGRRVRNLGPVSWQVTVQTPAGTSEKSIVNATARAWEDQLVANRPISGRQVIRSQDVAERRALVEHIEDAPLLTRDQAVGQQAGMDLRPGTVLTSRMVEAVPLARQGQLVTVTLRTGGVEVRTVGTAVDTGTYGQTIRVKNESTKEMYEVILTGPQQAILTAGPGSAMSAGSTGGRSNG